MTKYWTLTRLVVSWPLRRKIIQVLYHIKPVSIILQIDWWTRTTTSTGIFRTPATNITDVHYGFGFHPWIRCSRVQKWKSLTRISVGTLNHCMQLTHTTKLRPYWPSYPFKWYLAERKIFNYAHKCIIKPNQMEEFIVLSYDEPKFHGIGFCTWKLGLALLMERDTVESLYWLKDCIH